MNILHTIRTLSGDLYRLFYPPVCPVCGKGMPVAAGFMCTSCRYTLPTTNYWNKTDNPVREMLSGHIPLMQASAFFHYWPGSEHSRLIYRFKYSGGWRIARDTGQWFGSELARSGLYETVDAIIPVPLHRRKLLTRGYNQSLFIAEGISRAMNVEVMPDNLIRIRHGKSQTRMDGRHRWTNVDNAFTVRRPADLSGKHILLIDDVLTTGATVISCGKGLINSVPDCRLSVATLGVASRH